MKKLFAMLFGFTSQSSFTAFSGGSKVKTVNGALAAFNKALDDLKAVEQAELEEVARQAQIAADAEAARKAAQQEAQRAAKAITKIAAIVGEV